MGNTSAYQGNITRDFRSENPIHNEHIEEFKIMMANAIETRVPEIARKECASLINEAVNAMIGALHYDIETSLEIAFRDLGEMYKDKRTRQFISDTICKAIEKRLNSIKLEVKL